MSKNEVKECEYYYGDGNCKTSQKDMKIKCELNENCFTKQLQQLKEENEKLKIDLSSTKCPICGEGFLNPEGLKLYEEKQGYKELFQERAKEKAIALDTLEKIVSTEDCNICLDKCKAYDRPYDDDTYKLCQYKCVEIAKQAIEKINGGVPA